MSANQIFDPLKARIIDEEQGKVFHLKKQLPDVFVYFPGQNQRILNSTMLRIFEDFDVKNPIGYGLFTYDEKKTEVDLYLNYNTPIRLDLENDIPKYLYMLYDVKKPNNFSVLDCVLDNSLTTDTLHSQMIIQFIIGKDTICS